MPAKNLRGGKAFKRGKKGGGNDDEEGGPFLEREISQDYARVVRMLGDRRVVCFCNDGMTRVCKIRGALCKGPKKQRIEAGDIVLICMREYEYGIGGGGHAGTSLVAGEIITTQDTAVRDSGRKEIGDIVHKYNRKHWRRIRTDKDLHANLFLGLSGAAGDGDDDIFDDGGGDGEAEEAGEAGEAGVAGEAGEAEEDSDPDIDAI